MQFCCEFYLLNENVLGYCVAINAKLLSYCSDQCKSAELL